MVKASMLSGSKLGVKIAAKSDPISHFLYFDDTLFFASASCASANVL